VSVKFRKKRGVLGKHGCMPRPNPIRERLRLDFQANAFPQWMRQGLGDQRRVKLDRPKVLFRFAFGFVFMGWASMNATTSSGVEQIPTNAS
jgi:hypothetical protein